MFDFILKILLAYLLGSLLGSLIIGRLKGGVDIRTQGSGNAGGTNALRTQGWKFAAGVMLIDIGKGWLAAAWLPLLSIPGLSTEVIDVSWLKVGCAMAVVFGHVYPVWFGFRGGKGAATLIGVLLGLVPASVPYVMLAWLLVLMFTGFVGLSTMLACVAFNVWLWFNNYPARDALWFFGLSMLVFVVYTHRGNIQRMRAGNENRARKLWLFKNRA
ncbi:MAG: glycerol-3-phosphate 1-O-acyltransferase PlsY [Steroidobacteraceae bacterium]